jgi:DNA (cytosine-5)-methyltransferase 1
MRVVSLFSGAGGLDLGLIQAGHEIIWANDIFADAVATYRLNIGDHVDTRDIREIDESDIPNCDVIVGGFPCQGFSVANWGRTADDPRNALYSHFVRIVRSKKPKYFVAENVKGLASMEKGEVLNRIVADFEACGYQVRHHLVNAADYGVPQTRIRILIVGIRNDVEDTLPFPPEPTHANPGTLQGLSLKPWLTVGEALARFPEPEEGADIPNHEGSKYKLRFNGHLGHRFIDPNKPAPTVTSRGDDKGGVVVLHHPGNKRRMTARELAAVQAFPDDFVFVGTKTSAYRQISNAVPPTLGEAVGLMLQEKPEIKNQQELVTAGDSQKTV